MAYFVLLCIYLNFSFNPDGDDIVIRRDIFRDSSQWQVNGRKSNTKAVRVLTNSGLPVFLKFLELLLKLPKFQILFLNS